MPSRDAIVAQIKCALVDVLELDLSPDRIGDDDDLFSGGMGVDSVEALEILTEIERRFGVKIPEDDVGFGLFQSVGSLAEAVEAALGARAGGAP